MCNSLLPKNRIQQPFNSYSKHIKYVKYRKVFEKKIFELSQSPIYPLSILLYKQIYAYSRSYTLTLNLVPSVDILVLFTQL